LGCSFRIRIPDPNPDFLPIPDPDIKKALDPDPQHRCYLIEIEDVLWCWLLRAVAVAGAATGLSELNAGNVQILRRNGGLGPFVLCSARILG
jgi:hypothetical protein